MKVGILTFQFAHNYGAMLQAYALRRFLSDAGFEAEIVSYYPKWAQKEYAISPFDKDISYRKRIRFLFQYPKRKRVVAKFEDFRREALTENAFFESSQELVEHLDRYDCVVFGSDQIWNDKITGKTADYYGADTTAKRVSYAASLGTRNLTEWQQKCAETYLPRFASLSVREPHSKVLLEKVIQKQITTVLDPVFLISEETWSSQCNSINVDEQFMFLYLLRDDDELLKHAQKYAVEKKLIIYEVHPTLAKFHPGCHSLIDVGPKEFLWLIQNAQCVCTNSFHATSFSMIFGKKLLHIPNANSPERTTSLLERMGYSIFLGNNLLPLYDLSNRDKSRLESLASDSKQFLLGALEGTK